MTRFMLRAACLALFVAASLAPGASAAPAENAGETAPCGVVTDPVCWTSRFSCEIYGPFVEDTIFACRNFTGDDLHTARILSFAGDVAMLDLEADCENYGVIIMVTGTGTNRYCADGECANAGLIIMIGYSESCYGKGFTTICAAERCIIGPDGVGELSLEGAARGA